MKQIRILIVDNHELMRLGLATLIRYTDDLAVVGAAENGKEAIPLVRSLKPDIILMDLRMPVMDGVETTSRIHAEFPEIKIVILTTYGTSADVASAVKAGASAALVKDTPNDELLAAIRAIAAGKRVFSREISRTIADNSESPELTSRQKEILKLVVDGQRNYDIGRNVGISTDAVKQQVKSICTKLGAANRAEAVAIALRKHLLKM